MARRGAQYRNPQDQELRLDFVTSKSRGNRFVVMKELNLALEPLKFMEFSLEQTTQGCVFSNLGSCVVNLPAPERLAVHKLIVFGERPVSERAKATKDLLQATSIASYFIANGQADVFNAAWRDAIGRGKGWQKRAEQGGKQCCGLRRMLRTMRFGHRRPRDGVFMFRDCRKREGSPSSGD
ncbi:MAG: nucleotidyltransferase domain-containing protein [Rhodocyclaceae bacterium]|nr:nucleotidyltransferase domain-containing protein [Rhodocyclaceae bacterium]